MSLAARALGHVLRQNPWAGDRLRPHAGRTIKLTLAPFEAMLTISDEGNFLPAAPGATADATIRIPPGAMLRLMADQPPEHVIQMDGDTTLATDVGAVLRQLQWEYEEDLSRLIGDIPAHALVTLGHQLMAESKRQWESLATAAAEYFVEERPLIAKRRHLERFARDVDALRDDVERLARRMEKLDRTS